MMSNAVFHARRRAWLGLLLAALLPGCGDGGDGPVTERAIPVAAVQIQGVPEPLYVGASAQLTGVAQGDNGTPLAGRAIAWATSDTTIARISPQGMVTGRREGDVFVTATSESKSATALLAVRVERAEKVVVTGQPTGPVRAGTTFQLQATTQNAAGAPLPRPVFWVSNNQSLATVTAQGLVTAVRGGLVMIGASADQATGWVQLQITDTVAVVAVTPPAAALYATQTIDLSATAKSAYDVVLTGRPVAWSTSDPSRATVDGAGKVTALNAGTVSITATVEGKTASAALTVRSRPVGSWAGAADWTTYQGNARHTGYVPVTADPVVFRELWVRRPLGANPLTPAAEGGGKVFVSGNGAVAAVDARTGATAWTYDMGNVQMVDAPAYGNGRVFVSTGSHADAYFYGIDAASGSVAFRTFYFNQFSSWFAPVVSGGLVFKGGGGYGGMYAYSAATGDERWFQDQLSQDDGWTPAVDGSRVYAYTAPFEEGELVVHDAATGARLFGIRDNGWRWGQMSYLPTPVLGTMNDAVITQGDRLVSFNLQARTVGWERLGSFRGTPVVAGGTIYVFSGNDVEVRRENDGSLAWIWSTPRGGRPEAMLATDNLLFVSTASETYAVDVNARQHVWSYPAGGHLALTRDGILVITQQDGDMAAIDLK